MLQKGNAIYPVPAYILFILIYSGTANMCIKDHVLPVTEGYLGIRAISKQHNHVSLGFTPVSQLNDCLSASEFLSRIIAEEKLNAGYISNAW